MSLATLIDRLEAAYGKPGPMPARGPWEMIVWENVVYLGFGEEKGGYAATYRSAQSAAETACPPGIPWRIRAYQTLRRHGQETCRRSDPECERCPISDDCRFFQTVRRRR